MKTIVITGVEGQDGSLLAENLVADYNVIGTGRNTKAKFLPKTVKLFESKNFKFKTLDLTSAADVESLIKFNKPHAVVNLAARTRVMDSYGDPKGTLESNLMGFTYILEAVRHFSPETIIINAGSTKENIDESPYAISKTFCRKIFQFYKNNYQIDGCQPYFTNHVSSRQPDYFVIPKIIKGVVDLKAALENGEPVRPIVLGDLDSKCDWIDADIVIDVIRQLIEKPELRQTDPYVASGETHSVLKVVEIALKAVKIPYEPTDIPTLNGMPLVESADPLKRKCSPNHFSHYFENDFADELYENFGIERRRLSLQHLIEKLINAEINDRPRKI